MITPTIKCLQFHVAAILIDHFRNRVLRAKHDGRTDGKIVVADQIMARNHGHFHFLGFRLPRASMQQWLTDSLSLLLGERCIFNIACYI
jgi:hypothetical protein